MPSGKAPLRVRNALGQEVRCECSFSHAEERKATILPARTSSGGFPRSGGHLPPAPSGNRVLLPCSPRRASPPNSTLSQAKAFTVSATFRQEKIGKIKTNLLTNMFPPPPPQLLVRYNKLFLSCACRGQWEFPYVHYKGENVGFFKPFQWCSTICSARGF